MHAYLILAHNQPRLLQVLVDMIDDERNDIYIHVDAKADMRQFASLHAEKSKITFTKRIKVYWGHYSIVKAELILFEKAFRQGPYLYYHLLSGSDLPLKNQDYIHHLLDHVYRGHEFLGYDLVQCINLRVRYYYLFDKYFNGKSSVVKMSNVIRNKFIVLQKKIKMWRNENVAFYKGSQWMSITNDLCRFILANRKKIRRYFIMTFAPDESFVQTLVYDSFFYEKVHNKEDEFKSSMRLIDWERRPNINNPYTWKCEDWDEMVSSDRLFARKFSEDDMDFIYQLKDHVLNSKHYNEG